MTTPLAFTNAREAVIDYLTEVLPPKVSVGATFPVSALPDDDLVLQVAHDTTPVVRYPLTQWATVRTVAWAANPSDAERLLALTQAYMLAYPGGNGVHHISALTGPSLATDPDTNLWMCWAAFRVQARSTTTLPTL